MNGDEAFQAWLAKTPLVGPEYGGVALAKAAWDAALAHAAKVASDTAKRYTCSKRRGLCFAIADQIKRAEQ